MINENNAYSVEVGCPNVAYGLSRVNIFVKKNLKLMQKKKKVEIKKKRKFNTRTSFCLCFKKQKQKQIKIIL